MRCLPRPGLFVQLVIRNVPTRGFADPSFEEEGGMRGNAYLSRYHLPRKQQHTNKKNKKTGKEEEKDERLLNTRRNPPQRRSQTTP